MIGLVLILDVELENHGTNKRLMAHFIRIGVQLNHKYLLEAPILILFRLFSLILH